MIFCLSSCFHGGAGLGGGGTGGGTQVDGGETTTNGGGGGSAGASDDPSSLVVQTTGGSAGSTVNNSTAGAAGSNATVGNAGSSSTSTPFNGTLEDLCNAVCEKLAASCAPEYYSANCTADCLTEVTYAGQLGCQSQLAALGQCCLRTPFPVEKCAAEGVAEVGEEDCDDDEMCPLEGSTYEACAYP